MNKPIQEATPLTYKEMQAVLMKELRLYHYPVAVKFFYDEKELQAFRNDAPEIHTPLKPMTFCQWELGARMKGQIVYSGVEGLGCANAKYSFGWKGLDEGEIKGHAKYTRDLEQAERFVKSKPTLDVGLLGIAVAPLGSIDGLFEPDTVHFYCDNMQAYHLAVDYMAATDTHPLRPSITMNSSACGGNVFSFLEQEFNMLPACSGSYNAGKTERGEINVVIPGKKFKATFDRLTHRIREASSSITRPGDGFPGADICKNCPLIIFRKEERA
jgi:uncharacterized protein (DUF169 family)